MTTATFFTEGTRITGFQIKGHSGYAEAGSDIVCAAVTACVSMIECAVNDVLGLEVPVKVREKEASITLKLPAGLGDAAERTCQTMLTALMLQLVSIHSEHPDNLTVLEAEESA